ncbi:MAG: phospholipase D family protein [Gammaproteobacteria bacterium]|nr:phospholipase D family protein [Gammaproteobacteria bacterium]
MLSLSINLPAKPILFLALLLLSSLSPASPLESLKAEASQHPGTSGVTVLEKGEASLLARAWLTEKATSSIHVQYFIWSTDNIGTLASEALLRAADRGIKVKVIVDDLLIDAEPETLLSLGLHPNVEIKIYNPQHSVGVSFFRRVWNLITNFRGANQRMHDKTAIFDNTVAITGGRNMADEYYDYDQKYNFRDRDVLVTGPVVSAIEKNFNEFWQSPLSVPLEELLSDERKSINSNDIQSYRKWLRDYANNPENYSPDVLQARAAMDSDFPKLVQSMSWAPIEFISDYPGKNGADNGLSGGGESTTALVDLIKGAKQSITIQSPYLIMPEGGLKLFSDLIKQGIKVRISTNSLKSTDNLQAFSGYYKQRQSILDAGIELYEYKPEPEIMRTLIDRYAALEKRAPLFALHAKTLVVDGQITYIGTFNFDPRSAHLNTEVGVIIDNTVIAEQVEAAIMVDISTENSWNPAHYQAGENPGDDVPFFKRLKLWFWSLLPLEPIL